MQQSCIALQIISQINMIINDPLEIIDRTAVITAAEMKHGNLIIQYQYAMRVDEQFKVGKLIFYFRYQLEALLECSVHEMLIDLCLRDVNEGLNPEVVMLTNTICFCKLFKFFQIDPELIIIAKIKMCI